MHERAGLAVSLLAVWWSMSCLSATEPQDSRPAQLPPAPHPWLLASAGEREGRAELVPQGEGAGGSRRVQGRLLDQGQTLLLEESHGMGETRRESVQLLRATADGRSLQMAALDPSDGILRSFDGTYDPEQESVRWEPYWPRGRDRKRWWLVSERLPDGAHRWRRWELTPDGKETEVRRIVYTPVPPRVGEQGVPRVVVQEPRPADQPAEAALRVFAGAWGRRADGSDGTGVEARITSLGEGRAALLHLRVERSDLAQEAFGLLALTAPPANSLPAQIQADLALLLPGEPCVLSLAGQILSDGSGIRFADPERARVLWSWTLGDERLDLSWAKARKQHYPPPLGVEEVSLARGR